MTPIPKRMLTARIKVLPEEVAAKIAAGEVVDRPASVLKELLENALDAGASKLRITVEKAGRKLIRVTDDGCGMTPEDMRVSVRRHATSKITALEDLDRLGTYGFRGEALYSVAAVSRLTLASCPKGAPVGHRIELEAGKAVRQEPAPPLAGTTVEVKSLFFNTPARAKFLKSDGTERSHLTRVVEECALAHPEITFGYTLEGTDIFHLPGKPVKNAADDFLKRAKAVLGKDLFTPLTAQAGMGELKVLAYLAPPDQIVYTRGMQHWYVNERPVISKTLSQALYKAYEPYRPVNLHPYCVVYLELPPSHYDVNVHPAKREIRFRFEREVFDTLFRAFQKALVAAKPVPSAFGSRPLPPMVEASFPPAADGGDVMEAAADYGPRADVRLSPASPLASALFKAPETRGLSVRFLGQLEKTYLVFEDQGGILLVDQHAAAERVLFERFLDELQSGGLKVQPLMLPVTVEMRPSDLQRLESYKEDLKLLGYEIDRLGRGTLALTSQPAAFEMDAADLQRLVLELLEDLPKSAAGGRDRLRDILAQRACRKALKAHESLTPDAAVGLLTDLRACLDATACPHGRPTTLAITRDELARRFGRPGPPPL